MRDHWFARLPCPIAPPPPSASSSTETARLESQVRTLAQLDVMKRARDSGRQLQIHGWVYGLDSGRVRDLLTLTAANPSREIVAAE